MAGSLEQRQLSKVLPVGPDPLFAAGHDHRINPKTGRRRSCPVCRLEKKRLRAEREGKWLDAVVGVSKELIREGTRATGQVASSIARAHGHAIHGWLSNPDPITWGGGAVATIAYITWLTIVLKDLAMKLNLPLLAKLIPSLPTVTREQVDDVLDDTFIGRNDASPPPPPPPNVTTYTYIQYRTAILPAAGGLTDAQYFDTQAAAEQNFIFRQTVGFNLRFLTGDKLKLQLLTFTVVAETRQNLKIDVAELKSWP